MKYICIGEVNTTRICAAVLVICYARATIETARAGVTSEAAESVAKVVMRQFGREVAEEGAEQFTKRLMKFGSQYGDDALKAVEKAGPSAMKITTDAGDLAPEAITLLSKYGDKALAVASDSNVLKTVKLLGDDAAEVAVKHGRVAIPFCEQWGAAGAKAMSQLSPQNGRRWAIMLSDGSLSKVGTNDQVLDLLQRYGNRGVEFLWENKIALVVAGTATAFWANPEPFIEGAEKLVPPIISPVTELAKEASAATNWTLVMSLIAVSLIAIILMFVRPLLDATNAISDWLVSRLSSSRKEVK